MNHNRPSNTNPGYDQPVNQTPLQEPAVRPRTEPQNPVITRSLTIRDLPTVMGIMETTETTGITETTEITGTTGTMETMETEITETMGITETVNRGIIPGLQVIPVTGNRLMPNPKIRSMALIRGRINRRTIQRLMLNP